MFQRTLKNIKTTMHIKTLLLLYNISKTKHKVWVPSGFAAYHTLSEVQMRCVQKQAISIFAFHNLDGHTVSC
jgi:hypothetical protein